MHIASLSRFICATALWLRQCRWHLGEYRPVSTLCLALVGALASESVHATTYQCLGTVNVNSTRATWSYAATDLSNQSSTPCNAEFGSSACTAALSDQNGGVTNRSAQNPCPQPPASAVHIREGSKLENGVLSFKNYVGTWAGPWDPEICLGNRETVGTDPLLYDVSAATNTQCTADFGASACTWASNPPTLPPPPA